MFDYKCRFGETAYFTWLSSIGIQLFGVNEFAATRTSLLVGAVCLGCLQTGKGSFHLLAWVVFSQYF